MYTSIMPLWVIKLKAEWVCPNQPYLIKNLTNQNSSYAQVNGDDIFILYVQEAEFILRIYEGKSISKLRIQVATYVF